MIQGPIGVFDSGYGGLTVFKAIKSVLPEYDYIYLGDNARAPYGPRTFESIYEYTLESVKILFDKGCPLVVLACNTASAKALRTIQQKDLPLLAPDRRVLGVIRPTTEMIGQYTLSRKVGILATTGTVVSQSYVIEINKFFPDITVYQQACPMWVPLVENNEHLGPGADYFVEKYIHTLINMDNDIDTIVLGCTHYPLLINKIKGFLPPHIQIISQGNIVAESLADYLIRHPEIEEKCLKNREIQYFTTESAAMFDQKAALFLGEPVKSEHVAV